MSWNINNNVQFRGAPPTSRRSDNSVNKYAKQIPVGLVVGAAGGLATQVAYKRGNEGVKKFINNFVSEQSMEKVMSSTPNKIKNLALCAVTWAATSLVINVIKDKFFNKKDK